MRLIALEYHDVVSAERSDESGFPGRDAASYKVGPEDFAAHLAALASASFRAADDLRTLVARAPERAAFLLTFDDGGASARDEVAARLEEKGWRGYFFVVSDCIDRPGFLGAADLRALTVRGHVIGSHSRSHPLRMSALSRPELAAEWKDSLAALADRIGAAVDVASVPGGGLSRAVAETAAEAGIRLLFTSEPTTRVVEVGGCRIVGRFTIRRGMGAPAVRRIVGPSPVARAGQWARWNAKKAAKAVGGSAYLAARRWVFERR